MSASDIDWVRASRAALALALPTPGVGVSDAVSPEDIAQAAKRHGIAAEAHHEALRLGLHDIAQALQASTNELTINGMRLLARTNQFVDMFQSEHIPCLVMKGVGLARLTRTNPLGRPASDVDLLIPPDAVLAAHKLLISHGGRLAPGFIPPDRSRAFGVYLRLRHEATYVANAQKLDLHWHLGSVRSILPSTTDALARATTVQIQGFSLPTLGVHDALIHSAVHWRTFGFRKLKYVLDIEALRAQLTPTELTSLPLFVKKVLIVSRALRTSTPDVKPRSWVPRAMWWQATNALAVRASTPAVDTRARLTSMVAQLYETPGRDRLMVPLQVGIGPVMRSAGSRKI